MPKKIQRITTCLAFETQAEDAAKYYVSLFKNDAKIIGLSRGPVEKPGKKKGAVVAVLFSLFGQEFLAINANTDFKFTHAVSLMVNCDTQKEIDRVWNKLAKGGKEIGCGWVQDKFGVSWQVVPANISKMLLDRDPAKGQRVLAKVVEMKKLDLAMIERAYAGKGD